MQLTLTENAATPGEHVAAVDLTRNVAQKM